MTRRSGKSQLPADFLTRSDGAIDGSNGGERIIRYVFSDTSVGRDDHTIQAWDLQNFLRNPVFLWAHQADEPPIGRVVDIIDVNGKLTGGVEYIEHDIYPFADTIFQLVKGRFLNATSTGWDPIDWRMSNDKNRPRGIDFKLVDLLEISQVPVPALPTALATARASGIDTGPLYEWAEKVLDGGNMILIPRDELELLRREAKMPANRRTKPKDQSVAEVASEDSTKLIVDTGERRTALLKRGLNEVAWLAMLLCDLGYIEDMVEWEAALEEDGSPVPAQLTAAMKALGQVLIDMTIEEVTEQTAEEDAEMDGADVADIARGIDAKRSAFKLLRRLDGAATAALTSVMRSHLAGHRVTFQDNGVVAEISRAGKVLSSKNEKSLRDAHEMLTRGCDMVRSVFDDAADDDESTDAGAGDEEGARALEEIESQHRERRARAHKRRAGLTLIDQVD